MAALGFKILNPAINTILRSLLHWPLSKRLMTIHYRGRKSGRDFRVPVSYFDFEGDSYCFTDGRWWHNFKQPTAARLRQRGRNIDCEGQAVRDDRDAFERVMSSLLDKFPSDARYYGVAMSDSGQPLPGELETAFDHNVMVKFSPV